MATMPSPLTILLIAIAGIFCQNGVELRALADRPAQRSAARPSSASCVCWAAATPWPRLAGYRAVDACLPACTRAKWQTTFSRLILMVLPWFVGLAIPTFGPGASWSPCPLAFLHTRGCQPCFGSRAPVHGDLRGWFTTKPRGANSLPRSPARSRPWRYLVYAADLVTIGFCALCGLAAAARAEIGAGPGALLGLVGFALVAFRQRHPARRGPHPQHVPGGVRDLRVSRGHRCLAGRAPHARRGQLPNSLSRRERRYHGPRRPHRPDSGRQRKRGAPCIAPRAQTCWLAIQAALPPASTPYLPALAVERIRRAAGEGPATFEWLSRHLDDGSLAVLDRGGACARERCIDGRSGGPGRSRATSCAKRANRETRPQAVGRPLQARTSESARDRGHGARPCVAEAKQKAAAGEP